MGSSLHFYTTSVVSGSSHCMDTFAESETHDDTIARKIRLKSSRGWSGYVLQHICDRLFARHAISQQLLRFINLTPASIEPPATDFLPCGKG
jgi:hypothetical protein